MIIRGRLTTLETDTPVPDGTEGQVRTLDGDNLIATVTTNNGWYEYTQSGSPGPVRVYFEYGGKVRNSWSKITGPSGPVDVGNIPLLFRTFRNGVIPNLSGQLAVSSTGSDMNLDIALGAAVVQGVIYDQIAPGILTVEAASSQPRIDTVVVRVVPPGAGENVEGKSELAIVKGVPAPSPVQPALTQTSMLWEIPLANVAVGATVTVIGSGQVTDRRAYTTVTIPAGSIGTTELADGSVTSAKIADGTIQPVDMHQNALGLYSVKLSGTGVNDENTPINRINFNGDFFDVVLNGGFSGRQVDISLNSGGASRPVFMPGSEYVATGVISSGVRTLVTMGVGPLPATVPYAVLCYHGVTLRNTTSSGTVAVRTNINGGTQRTHEFQNVGGVPRWAPVIQTAVVTMPSGGSFNVTGSVQFLAAANTDVRAGWIQVVALPASILAGV